MASSGRVPADTASDALAVQRAAWLRLGSEGRVHQMVELSETMRRVALDGISTRHPELDANGVVRRYIREVHGVDLDVHR